MKKLNNSKRTLLTSLLTLILLFFFYHIANASKVNESEPLGGININSYCNYEYSGKRVVNGTRYLVSAKAVLVKPKNAYSWRCELTMLSEKIFPTKKLVEIDLNRACQWEYKNGKAYAKTTIPTDPYSWKCYK